MFSYHYNLRKLLRNEEYYVKKEKDPFVYRFFFPKIKKSYPIRQHRLDEYKDYIK